MWHLIPLNLLKETGMSMCLETIFYFAAAGFFCSCIQRKVVCLSPNPQKGKSSSNGRTKNDSQGFQVWWGLSTKSLDFWPKLQFLVALCIPKPFLICPLILHCYLQNFHTAGCNVSKISKLQSKHNFKNCRLPWQKGPLSLLGLKVSTPDQKWKGVRFNKSFSFGP